MSLSLSATDSKADSLYITLNNSPYKIYELDTIESIKIRISSNIPIVMPYLPGPLLPNLIILEEVEQVNIATKVVAGCKAVHIKHTGREEINPLAQRKFKLIDFYNLASTRLKSAGGDQAKHKKYAEEIMKLFNLDVDTYIKYVIYFVFGGLDKFQTKIDPSIRLGFIKAIEQDMARGNFDIIKLQYDAEKDEIKKKVQNNLNEMQKDLALFNEFVEKLIVFDEPARTSTIQLDKTRISVKFQIATDVYELFNGLRLSPNIPFINVGNFYKVIKTFKPPKQWAEKFAQEDLLVMYVLNRKIESENNKIKADVNNYSPVFIIPASVDETTHLTNIEMEIESRVDDELREENLLERIFEAFPFPVNNCSYEQKRVEADYLLLAPGSLDIPLFFDMVMNDPLISQLMVIDESSRTFRERGGIFSYFRWNSHVASKNFMSCRINIGLIEAKQQSRAPDIFTDLGEPYLSVKMFNCSTLEEARRFREILNRILEYYYS